MPGVSFQSLVVVVVVTHDASRACMFSAVRLTPSFLPLASAASLRARNASGVPPGSFCVGVFHDASRAAPNSFRLRRSWSPFA